jgi:putative SOS response-associated peptidase YedK
MCYHNSINKASGEIVKRYKAKNFDGENLFKPIYHATAFEFPKWPVIASEDPASVQFFNWGLIPNWVKTGTQAKEIRINTLNAKSETVMEKPSFSSAIKKQRCLVPSTGFFEWMQLNKQKYPHFIRVKSQEIFSMAGIWEQWPNGETGEIHKTFSILTTEANSLMAKIHNTKKRMPVIISSEHEQLWLQEDLKPADIAALCLPFPVNQMETYTVSRLITDQRLNTNVKEAIEPFEYPELEMFEKLL